MPLYRLEMNCYIDGVLYERGVHELPKDKAPKWAEAVDKEAKAADDADKASKSTTAKPAPVALSELNKAKGGKSFNEAMGGKRPPAKKK